MKKTLVALVMAGGMVLGGTVVANAATTVTTATPSITKPAASAAEGTGKHEMAETATKQTTEGVALAKKKTGKKTIKHLVKKTTKKTTAKK
ncbi:MAG TPA: hypothetical protein VF307_00665 [Candidatus Nanopelagicaceae bacterium]